MFGVDFCLEISSLDHQKTIILDVTAGDKQTKYIFFHLHIQLFSKQIIFIYKSVSQFLFSWNVLDWWNLFACSFCILLLWYLMWILIVYNHLITVEVVRYHILYKYCSNNYL